MYIWAISILYFTMEFGQREWEEELLRRTEAIKSKLDYERLKQMMGSKTEVETKTGLKAKVCEV